METLHESEAASEKVLKKKVIIRKFDHCIDIVGFEQARRAKLDCMLRI